MKNLRLPFSFFIYSLFIIHDSFSQDTHFSQFIESPLTMNPALAGFFDGDFRAIANYRNQWSSVDGFKTMQATCDGNLLKNKWTKGFLGLGLNVLSDQAGAAGMNSTQFNLSVSVAKYLRKHSSLSFGLQGGYAQRSIDYSPLTWGNQYDGLHYDASLPSGEPTSPSSRFSYTDFSAGVVWNLGHDEVFYSPNNGFGMRLGMALYHVTHPRYSFYDNSTDYLHSRFVFHGSMVFGTPNVSVSYMPSFMFEKQGAVTETEIGFGLNYILSDNSRYSNFMKGTSLLINAMYRFGDSFVPSMQFKIANYGFGMSYDINTSGLHKAVTGGVEVFVKYTTPNPFTVGKK